MKLGEVIVSGGGLLAAVMTLLQIAPFNSPLNNVMAFLCGDQCFGVAPCD